MAKVSVRDPIYERVLARYPGCTLTEAIAQMLGAMELMERLPVAAPLVCLSADSPPLVVSVQPQRGD